MDIYTPRKGGGGSDSISGGYWRGRERGVAEGKHPKGRRESQSRGRRQQQQRRVDGGTLMWLPKTPVLVSINISSETGRSWPPAEADVATLLYLDRWPHLHVWDPSPTSHGTICCVFVRRTIHVKKIITFDLHNQLTYHSCLQNSHSSNGKHKACVDHRNSFI